MADSVRADLHVLGDLPLDPGETWGRRRRAFLFASARLGAVNELVRIRSEVAIIVVLGIVGLPAEATVVWDATQSHTVTDLKHPLVGFSLVLLGALVVVPILNVWLLGATWRMPVVRVSRARRRAVMLALPGSMFAAAPLVNRVVDPFSALGFFWQGCRYGAVMLLLLHVTWASFDLRYNRKIHHRCQPTDRLLVLTLFLAADIHRSTRGRLAPPTCSRLCRAIEDTAQAAGWDLSMPYRLPRQQGGALRQEALRIASVYRAHMVPLTLVRTPADGDRLVASLLAAVDALIDGNRAALLANAPAKVEERRLVRRVLVRAWPPVVLIACGIGLPLIPSVADQGALASSLRWTLVVAGALTFVAGSDTATRVSGPLDKALPWK